MYQVTFVDVSPHAVELKGTFEFIVSIVESIGLRALIRQDDVPVAYWDPATGLAEAEPDL